MCTVVIPNMVRIPDWVADLEAFRRWARSEDFPERGWISYLDGELWVDLSMEQLFTHNQVKTQYTVVLGGISESGQLGYFFIDRVRLSNLEANLSTEPDGLFVSYEAIRTGRVRLIKGAEQGYIELEGSPDMALEVVSAESVKKDTEILRDLYWRAGITEYWLVDARREPLRFDILRRTARGYVASRRQGPWLKSAVFGKAFALEQGADPLGHPQFILRTRDR
jgi:Uma2 family endonuclease